MNKVFSVFLCAAISSSALHADSFAEWCNNRCGFGAIAAITAVTAGAAAGGAGSYWATNNSDSCRGCPGEPGVTGIAGAPGAEGAMGATGATGPVGMLPEGSAQETVEFVATAVSDVSPPYVIQITVTGPDNQIKYTGTLSRTHQPTSFLLGDTPNNVLGPNGVRGLYTFDFLVVDGPGPNNSLRGIGRLDFMNGGFSLQPPLAPWQAGDSHTIIYDYQG